MKKNIIRVFGTCLLIPLVLWVSASVFPHRGGSVIREIGVFELRAYAPDGSLLWEDEAPNSLADAGESIFLDCTLRATSCPSTFYLRLSDSSTPCSIADTDSLAAASSGEPSGSGYAAQQVTRNSTGWPTLALDSGDYMATSQSKTFSASGGSWGPVYCVFLATTSDNTGSLISYAALSTARTLADGESLQVTYKVKLQ